MARCIAVGCAVALLLCLDITSTIPICSAKSLTAAAEVRSAIVGRRKKHVVSCCQYVACAAIGTAQVLVMIVPCLAKFPKGTNLHSQ